MQRLKCSVAESEGHRIVFHNLNLTVMRKEIHIVSNPNRGGWDALVFAPFFFKTMQSYALFL